MVTTGKGLVGNPVGGSTPEIKLKWLQVQIAERDSAIEKLKIEINDLTKIQLPRLEGLILTHENDKKFFLNQLKDEQTIDV